jgi:hypothetical protein
MVRDRTIAAHRLWCAAALLSLVPVGTVRAGSQSNTRGDAGKPFSLEDPKYKSVIVAGVGNRAITAQEFLFSYEFGPAFTKRESDSRHHYLNFMVYEKLLALEGYERRLDTSGEARQTLAEFEGDLATEELYKDDIRSKIRIPESDIHRGIRKEREQLSVRWLYAWRKGRLDSLYGQLRSGVSFDSLFNAQLTDSVKADDRSMETTLFKIERKNPALAAVLDTMSAHSLSSPIPTPDGYYLVMLVNRWTNPLVTESEGIRLHSDVERAMVEQKSDSLSDLYIKRMMEGRHPVIIRKSFDILQTYLAELVLGPKKFSEWNLAERLSDRWGALEFRDPISFERQALAELSTRKFTARNFLNWYHAREYNLRLNSSSPQAFFLSLEAMVWRMVRDRLLTDRAIGRHLQHRENVRKQLQWWRDKIVYKLVRAGISDSIQSGDPLLRNYYDAHRRDYRGKQGDTLSFEKAKDDVQRDFYSFEMTKRLLHRLLRLKEKYKVVVREDNLKGLPIEDEFDPRAIDVYGVKKGGTFPRPAFPSIDYEWQAFSQ